MQQILQELQHGTQEVVKDNGDGSLDIRINKPSALQMRAARLIVQIATERDQVITSNQSIAKQLQQLLEENSSLNQQLKELNDRLNSSPVSPSNTSTPNQSDSGVDSDGKTETTGSEAS